MPIENPAYASATELAAAIARKEVSSSELVDFFLARKAERDGPLNIVVTVDEARARSEADEADRKLAAGEPVGPLHGVPMTIKDSFSTEGMRTTSGAPELSDHVPAEDADPVARLRAAGAIIWGKTNLPIYAGDVQSYNAVFGCTNNPWDTTRTVGGSSGGSAGALAAGFTPLELGSDIAGSIRIPAHTCGVMGHKPSYGAVSARGQIPGPPGTLTQADLAVAGPMARTVDDLELGMDILAGPNAWEDIGWSLKLPPSRHRELSDFRVAVWVDDAFCPVSSEARALLDGAVTSLEEGGARIDREARPAFEFAYASRVFDRLLNSTLAGGVPLKQIEEIAASARAAGKDNPHVAIRHREWLTANERRLQMRRKWRSFFEQWDVVLMPVTPTVAIKHDHSDPMPARTVDIDGQQRPYVDLMKWMGLTGVSFLPATVVPVGLTSGGLPVGIQIAGPYLEDRTTLQLARLLSARIGGCQTPPGF